MTSSYPPLSSMVDIVKSAASLMTTDSFKISQKEGFSNIVTSSDIAVQDFLCDKLSHLLPGSGFLCEEEDLWDSSKDFTWIIDPIDGTSNYSRGIDQCAICVGLKRDSEIIAGVVYIPSTNEMYSAEKNRGTTLNGRPVHVSTRNFQDSIMCTALSVYHKEYADICSQIITDTFRQCNDIRRFGACAPELCYLAAGRCELYFEYLLSVWDFSAASLIVTEAGGLITDLQGNKLSYEKHSGILAANSQENLNKLLDIVQRNL